MTTPKEISRLSELEELRLQNAEYAEQVKRLVRAEAKLYEVQETLDAQSATYRFLAESERKLASSRDVSEILQLALECIVTGARLQRAFILFADEPDAPLTHRYDDGFYAVDEQAQILGLSLDRGDPLLDELSRRQEPLHCYEGTVDPLLSALRSRFLMEEYIVLPLTRSFYGKDAGLMVAGNARVSITFTRVRKDSPVVTTLGSVASHVAATIENVRNYEWLQARNVEVEQASRTKSAFLATMSHELRTPLNAIIGFTRIVIRKAGPLLPPLQKDNLSKVETSAVGLLAIINDILDLSKVEAGRMDLQLAEVDARAVVQRVLEHLSPLMVAKDLGLVTELPLEPVLMTTDGQRLGQVLTNLVSNAIKFTRHGTLGVALASTGPDAVRFEVRDTGVGIPEEELERIFEPFHQVEGGTTRQVGGTGLGLAIVRELVRALGGTIRVESALHRGTLFTVDLPLRLRDASPTVTRGPE